MSSRPPARWAIACLTGGVLLVTAVLVVQSQFASAVADFGTDQIAEKSTSVASNVVASGGIGPMVESAPVPAGDGDSAPAPSVAAESPSPAPIPDDPPQAPAGIPLVLTIPKFDVTANVLPVTTENGLLGVPTDPKDVGWWTGSVVAGSFAGATIIDGHVDSAELGPGALYRLAELAEGDEVTVSVAGGGTVRYRVTSRRSYVKTDGLPPEMFGTQGAPRLVLITCGGSFDTADGSYRDNIAVFATPL